jgi:hypothetical protein
MGGVDERLEGWRELGHGGSVRGSVRVRVVMSMSMSVSVSMSVGKYQQEDCSECYV